MVAARKLDLSQSQVRELVDYDPETGAFIWRERGRQWFSDARSHARWNTIYAGKEAGHISSTGYYKLTIRCRDIHAHRLAFLHYHGHEPKWIDHINGDKLDNRIANLRAVTHSENMRNLATYKSNTSKVVGVNSRCDSGLWQARIADDDGNRISLGCFDDWWDAVCARKSAENKYGYHANHGRAAA